MWPMRRRRETEPVSDASKHSLVPMQACSLVREPWKRPVCGVKVCVCVCSAAGGV